MFQYWWKLALVGIWSFEWYVMNDENGNSLSTHMQEGMENWVGLLKQLQTEKIKPNAGWVLRIKNYLDLYVLGGLRENIVDFRVTKKKSVCKQHLIWQRGVTEHVLFEEKRKLPSKCREYLTLIDKIEFGDTSTIDIDLYVRTNSREEERAFDTMADDIDEHVDAAIINRDLNDESVVYNIGSRSAQAPAQSQQVRSRHDFLVDARNASHAQYASIVPRLAESSTE